MLSIAYLSKMTFGLLINQMVKSPYLGEDKEYGCCISCGYTWCQSLNECIRVWETYCESLDGH